MTVSNQWLNGRVKTASTCTAIAWQFSFKQQQSSEQSIIDRVSTPRISKEYLAAYHGINFTYVNREEPAMDKSFLLDMLEKRLAGGMPVLVGFDSYSCLVSGLP